MGLPCAYSLEVKGLVKSFRSRKVVKGISFQVDKGEVVGLLGPNGAGKTTVFKMIVGLERPDEGNILLNSCEITDKPIYKRARMGLGYLPQEPSIFRRLSVEQNLMAIMETLTIEDLHKKERVKSLLGDFELSHLKSQMADTLSGGERRRLEIARALVPDPMFILLDEPFAGIDPKAVVGIQDIVAQLKERGIGVIITDHNVRETLAITERSYILYDGEVLMEGTSASLVADEKARDVYLGERFCL